MDELTMAFTLDDWRMIASACMVVKPESLINGKEKKKVLKEIALRIALETGK